MFAFADRCPRCEGSLGGSVLARRLGAAVGEAVLRWFSDKNRNMDAAALESLGILVRHGSGRMVSNGGLILFGKADVRQHCFPDARLSCARFRGSDKSEFIDRQEMSL